MKHKLAELTAFIIAMVGIIAIVFLTGAMAGEVINDMQFAIGIVISVVAVWLDSKWIDKHFIDGEWI